MRRQERRRRRERSLSWCRARDASVALLRGVRLETDKNIRFYECDLKGGFFDRVPIYNASTVKIYSI